MRKIIVTSKFNIMDGSRNYTYSKNQNSRNNKEWIDYRMDIFQRYTLQSLKKQTNQDFTAVYVYDDISEALINEALSRYAKLPPNIIFVRKSEYTKTIENLCRGYNSLFYTRLDSDDMYHYHYIQKLHNYIPREDTKALISTSGYMYDSVGNRMANYFHDRFTYYTLIYRFFDLNNLFSSLDVTPYDLLVNFSHGRIVDYNPDVIEGRNFIFNIHGSNTDSGFGEYNWGFARTEGLITDENEKRQVLSQFL